MGHAVYHRTASGEAQLENVSSLEAGLELVERLRNEEGPTDVRLFKEISVEVRTYYKVVAKDDVEEAASESVGATADDVVADETSAETVDTTADDAAEDVSDEPAATAEAEDGEDDDVVGSDVVGSEVAEAEVAEAEAPAPSSAPTEPPAGAMPLLSPPPPSVAVHAGDGETEPAAASGSGRPKLFNRG